MRAVTLTATECSSSRRCLSYSSVVGTCLRDSHGKEQYWVGEMTAGMACLWAAGLVLVDGRAEPMPWNEALAVP